MGFFGAVVLFPTSLADLGSSPEVDQRSRDSPWPELIDTGWGALITPGPIRFFRPIRFLSEMLLRLNYDLKERKFGAVGKTCCATCVGRERIQDAKRDGKQEGGRERGVLL